MDSLFVERGLLETTPNGHDAVTIIEEGGLKILEEVQALGKMNLWRCDPGYPRAVHEEEVLVACAGTHMQPGHQDARFNQIIVFCYVSDCLQEATPSTFTTFVATKASLDPTHTGTMEYEQLPRPSTDDGRRWCLGNHVAWPHHGPGNPLPADRKRAGVNDRERMVVMYAFALDAAAERHTTGEAVYHDINIHKTSVVYA